MFPVNDRLLLKAVIAHPNLHPSLNDSLNDLHPQWLYVNLMFVKVMLVLRTVSPLPRLSWKEQLTSSAYNIDCKSRAELLARRLPFLDA